MKQLLLFLSVVLGVAPAYAATAPVAVNDSRNTPSNAAVTFSITANDTDADGNGTISLATVDLDPAVTGRQTTKVVSAQGSYAVDNAGNLTFTPGSNYTGTSTVSYTVQDNTGLLSNVATVTVNVGPFVVVDAANTARSAPVTVNVLANDTDVDGLVANTLDLNPGTASRQTTFVVTGGSFGCDNAGNVTFTPTSPYSVGLTAVVSYTVNDATGATSNVTTFTVTTVNIAPTATPDVAFRPSNTNSTFSVTANDTDPDGTLVLNTLDLDPTTAGRQATRTVSGQGSYTVDNAGNLSFVPNTNYTGTSTVTLQHHRQRQHGEQHGHRDRERGAAGRERRGRHYPHRRRNHQRPQQRQRRERAGRGHRGPRPRHGGPPNHVYRGRPGCFCGGQRGQRNLHAEQRLRGAAPP